VDLRYDHQVIVNPDSTRIEAKPKTVTASNAAPPASGEHKKKAETATKTKKHT
jgi:hypothetical protein